MLSIIKRILGIGPPPDYKSIVEEGAIIVDVRTPQEYKSGHIKQSINIPVDSLASNLSKLKGKETAIITCCASGMRSGRAKGILKSNGYDQVYNGGAWNKLNQKIS